ncbi:hypothetical protein CHU98_g8344 [Xylaria longipes]|nr:hypothetical protein CHU98_g8344 [Xylaria longipes]
MNSFKRKLSDADVGSDQIDKKRACKGEGVPDTASKLQRLLANFKDDAEDLVEDFMSEKKELEDKLKLAQQQIAQLVEDLQQIAGVQHNAPDLDNVLENQFMDLREQVQSFALNFCDSKISSSTIPSGLPDHVKKALAAVSGVPATRLLGSRLHARYFVQALIWRLLCDSFLTNPFLIWGQDNEIGEFIRKVQKSQKLPINRRQFWRKVTGQILVDIATPRPLRTAQWLMLLVDYIEPLVRAEYNDNIEEHVKPILDNAIELAKNLAQSRTMCVIQRKGPGADDKSSQAYDDKWMEVVEKNITSYEDIDFLITPALVQLTNSVGEAFNYPRVIVKAEVCFGQGRVPASAPRASDSSPSKDRAKKTQSGRQSRGVNRLGEVANEAEINEELGDDVDEVRDSGSDEYKDEPSPE